MSLTNTDTNATSARPRHEPLFRRSRVIDVLRGTAPRNLRGALGLLAAGLIVTVLASLYIKARVETTAQREFDFACNEIQFNIDARLGAAAQILRSGAALFDASETVSRKEWRIFTRRLQIEQQLPGIQGIGFALLIPREQLAQHVEAIRREGFPDYQVRPAGERETCSAIIYLEPFSDRNLRAFGYDMLSEPVRRAAMERARDGNIVALSGKVILVQETGQEVQAGALMYVPVYRHGLPIETIEQRRAAVQGWVYSPYRMTDLMRGTLSGWDVSQKGKQIRLRVYDGDVLSADTLLYNSQSAGGKALADTALLTRLIPVDFAGHRWTLRFTQLGGLDSSVDYGSVWLALLSGTIISLLIFGLMRSLINMRANAQQLREEITSRKQAELDLQASETRYRRLFESARDGMALADTETGQLLDCNESLCRMVERRKEELVGQLQSILHPPETDTGKLTRTFHQHGAGDLGHGLEDSLLSKSGKLIPVEIVAARIRMNDRDVLMGVFRDITDRKRSTEQGHVAHLETVRLLADAERSRRALLSMMEDQKRVEEERERMRTQLIQSQKLESIGTLAGGVAHEINNPIMGIMNYAQLIQDKLGPDSPVAEYATEIGRETERIATIVKNLLNFARADKQHQSPARLCDIVTDTLSLIRAIMRHDQIALEVDVPENLPQIKCRSQQLQQVVMNLLTNARDALNEKYPGHDENKKILITAREHGGRQASAAVNRKAAEATRSAWQAHRPPADQIMEGGRLVLNLVEGPRPPVEAERRWIRLTVEDRGQGIPENLRGRIFDPFFTTKPRDKGTGLGLSISHGIVKDHGGELSVESPSTELRAGEAGKWTRFHVDLPVA